MNLEEEIICDFKVTEKEKEYGNVNLKWLNWLI